MRSALRRFGSPALLLTLGAALLLAGTGASLGYAALREDAPGASPVERAREVGEGLALDARVSVAGVPVPAEPLGVHLEPGVARAVPLPGLTVDREVALEQAGVGARLGVDLRAGSHRVVEARGSDVGVATQQKAVLTPAAAPVALAAAAFTLAGLAAYFWGSVKAFATRTFFLPAIGLYAKITRAEVFDNDVRERIFRAIKENPGLAASDLSRLAAVSWGTTIYHLDVLEQTRMVSSLRNGRYRRYFENGANLPVSKEATSILMNPVTASVVRTIQQTPGATQKELAGATSMSPQALHWHLARLVRAGLVRKEREGRVVRHFSC